MKKTNFTFVDSLLRTAMSLILVLTFSQMQAQSCTMACADLLNVSVDANPGGNCGATLTAEMMLQNYDDALVNCAGNDVSNITLTVMDGPAVVDSGAGQVVVDESDAGYALNEVFSVKVQTAANTCWGSVIFEDKAGPSIDPATCADMTIDCTVAASSVAAPTAIDNCSGATVSLTGETVDTDELCGTGVVIERTYVAIDTEGNVSAPCTQTITINRVTCVNFPEDIAFSCTDYSANNNIVNAEPLTCAGLGVNASLGGVLDATVAPADCLATTGAGVPDVDSGEYCSYAVTSSDDILSICDDTNPNTFKIIRTWAVFDWCTNTVITDNCDNQFTGGGSSSFAAASDNVQVIKVIDVTAPTMEFAPNTSFTLSANLPFTETQDCRSVAALPVPTLADVCGNNLTLRIYTPVGEATLVNDLYVIPHPGLPMGTHTITYAAMDDCGNIREMPQDITIVDNLTPTPICDEITQISVGGSAAAVVPAAVFDDGSYDNCGIASMAVRRDADAFGDFVSFDCSDIANSPINVTLRVTDYAGNSNDCNVEVLVEDNFAPYEVSAPGDVTIVCDTYFDDIAGMLDVAETNGVDNPEVLQQFGTPTYGDNCSTNVTFAWSREVNSCGEGTITRTFGVSDDFGNVGPSHTQTITIEHQSDWSVSFPDDITLQCEPGQDELDGIDLGEPNVFSEGCGLIAISEELEYFYVVPDACYKVMRRFTAINWCVYDGNNLNDDTDNADGSIADGGDGVVISFQEIKVMDNIAPEITTPATQEYDINGLTDNDGDCDINVVLPEVPVSDCSENITVTYAVPALNGTGLNYDNVAAGTYTVVVTAVDNCGNQSSAEYDFTVQDAKKPTPYCLGGLVTELMPIDNDGDGNPDEGMRAIEATDFNVGSFDNCTAPEDLTFTANIGVDDKDSATDVLNFTCANEGEQNIFLYIHDEAGNYDVCMVTLVVESVPGVCGGDESPEISGALHTVNDEAIAGAMVEVNSGSMAMTTTNANGDYNVNVDAGSDVTVAPSYDTDYDEGVTTFDLVLIRQHILTVETFDNPYKMIAADANNNGVVSAADLVVIKSVILGINETFENNNSWVFVDASYDFPTNWTLNDGYPAVANINNIAENANIDFMAVKVGDVNGSWTNFNDDSEERDGNALIINAQDNEVSAGQEFTVEFDATENAAIAYQFTLDFAGLEIVNVNGNAEDFGIFSNALTTSWAGDKVNDNLFSVTFKALENVKLSEALTLSNRITKTEAYTATGEAMNIELNFENTNNTGFALHQNTPNPVNAGVTKIGFDLPKAASATITISDINGKTVQVINGDFAAGYNSVELNNLQGQGVMTYTLESNDYTATRKFVVLN